MKKTFILQTDVCKGILAMLDNEKSGILFRLIVDYVSGDNTLPVDEKMTPTDDMNINMAYAIVRAGLDANQRSYEDICEARREAGRKGAKTTNEKKTAKSAKVGKCRKVGKHRQSQQKRQNRL